MYTASANSRTATGSTPGIAAHALLASLGFSPDDVRAARLGALYVVRPGYYHAALYRRRRPEDRPLNMPCVFLLQLAITESRS